MKTFLICLVILSASLTSKAQLTNTKWTGTMMVPGETEVMLSFKKDSLYIIVNDEPVETMTYTVKDSLITAKKTDGKSPCNNNDAFTLKYTMSGNKLFIKDIADKCDPRFNAWTSDPFIKQN
jgi:hypothetical protein